MKKFYLILLILFFVNSCLQSNDFKRFWDTGKLTWEDFRERESSSSKSNISYYLNYYTDNVKIGNTSYVRYIADCYIDKRESWVDYDSKTSTLLQYNQVIFDILEHYRRRLQYQLDRVDSYFEVGVHLKQIYDNCEGEIERFKFESNYGQDYSVVSKWTYEYSDKLKESEADEIPNFISRPYAFGVSAGLGYTTFTPSLGDYFKPSFSLHFGFDLMYRNSIFFLQGLLGRSSPSQDLSSLNSGINWDEGNKGGLAIIDFSYGYNLINFGNIRIAPFGGASVTEFTDEDDDEGNPSVTLREWSWAAGINIEYEFFKKINLTPTGSWLSQREETFASMRLRIYVTDANYFDDLRGYSINMNLGISFFGRKLEMD